MEKLCIFSEKIYSNFSSAKEKFAESKGISRIYSFFKLVFWYLIFLILFPAIFLYGLISFVVEIEKVEKIRRFEEPKSEKR